MDHSDASGTDPLPWVRPEPPEETLDLPVTAVQQDPLDQPAWQEPRTREPALDETAAWEPVAEEPVAEEPVAEEPVAEDEPSVEEPQPEPVVVRREPEGDDLRHRHIAWVHLVEPGTPEPVAEFAAVAVIESPARHEPPSNPAPQHSPAPVPVADWSMPAPARSRPEPDHLPSALGRLVAVIVTAGIAWAVLVALGIWVAVLLLSR